MKQQKLPPVLTRADFDSDEEFALYTSTEAGEWASTGDLAEQKKSWKMAAMATIPAKRTAVWIASCKAFMSKLWQDESYITLTGQKYRQA